MTAAALNLLLIGAAIAVTAAVALALTRGTHPRARYVAALLAFAAAAVVPLVLTFTAAPAPAHALTHRVAQAAPPSHIVEAVWLAVALLLLLRELAGHVALARRYAAATETAWREDLPLLISEHGPATIGLLRPRVVLPRAWLDPAVARHELSHARWRDPLVHAVVRAVRAILWPALPLWYLEVVIRTEREAAADAAAVTAGEEHAYAATLVAVARTAAAMRRHAVGISGIGLEERIERLLAPSRPSAARRIAAVAVLFAGVLSIAALPVASARDAMPLHAVGNRWLDGVIAGTSYHDHTATKEVLVRLNRFRADGSMEQLAAALRHDDDRVRESSAWIAGVLGDRRAAPLLAERLTDSDPHTREAAAWALGRLR